MVSERKFINSPLTTHHSPLNKMFELFTNINIDWLKWRKIFIGISVVILLAGLASAIGRQLTPGGSGAFNLGVDFQGGTVVTAKFKQKPSTDEIRGALQKVGVGESVIQESTDKNDEILIKIPLIENSEAGAQPAPPEGQNEEQQAAAQKAQVNKGRATVKQALDLFGKEAEGETALQAAPDASYKIIGTDSVGAVAGSQLRNQAVTATLLGLLGILLFIAFRYDWTYAAGAVIAVFHDVLVTLAFFSVFQWEINLTVIAALLTLVGFSVNDSIVIFDRIRENAVLNRQDSLYKLTNDSINQTMSRTIITGGLVFLSVLALVLFGGEVLRAFSLALFVGVITGTYSTIAIASPIAIWWQDKLGAAKAKQPETRSETGTLASASRRSVTRKPVTR
jgi:preprotein translocase subunit SecF